MWEMLQEFLWEMLQEMLQEILQEMVRKMAWEIIRERVEGKNLFNKAVIGGNLALEMG